MRLHDDENNSDAVLRSSSLPSKDISDAIADTGGGHPSPAIKELPVNKAGNGMSSTLTQPSEHWRKNFQPSAYNGYGGMYCQIPMYAPSGGPSAFAPYAMQSGYGSSQAALYGYGQPGMAPETAWIMQYAHDQSRGAFDRAATAIQTVASITNMLDTVFMGCAGSFNAIVAVVAQLSQLKSTFRRVITAFSALRAIRWLYTKLLQLLGLRTREEAECAWQAAVAAQQGADASHRPANRQPFSWRRTVAISLLFAIPALLYQLLQALSDDLQQAHSRDEPVKDPASANWPSAASTDKPPSSSYSIMPPSQYPYGVSAYNGMYPFRYGGYPYSGTYSGYGYGSTAQTYGGYGTPYYSGVMGPSCPASVASNVVSNSSGNNTCNNNTSASGSATHHRAAYTTSPASCQSGDSNLGSAACGSAAESTLAQK